VTTSTTGRPAARTIAVLVLGLVTALWSAGAAAAHVAPDVTIVSPEGGADVSGTDVVVALSASAEGSGPAAPAPSPRPRRSARRRHPCR
jgi:hypothetical protein